jgi:hypothetical protein
VGEMPAQHIVNHRRPRTLFPATRSMPLTTSRDRVSEVFIFVFILPLYYLWKTEAGRKNAVRRRFRDARGSASCFPLKPGSADVVIFKVCGS